MALLLSDPVAIPSFPNSNNVSYCPERVMLDQFGKPGRLTRNCSEPYEEIAAMMAEDDVGPFTVQGMNFAVKSLQAIFAETKEQYRDVYDQVKTAGMLCVRAKRGNRRSFSNHSWGTAIDLYFGDNVVPMGSDYTDYGNAILAPIFNKHGWFWGAAFSTPDSMHFEIARETIEGLASTPIA